MASASLEVVRPSSGNLAAEAAAEKNTPNGVPKKADGLEPAVPIIGPVGPQQPAKKSNIFSPQFWFSRGSATNKNMLLFRTINPQLGLPNHNEDWLAPCFRDEVLPNRSFCIKRLTGHAAFLKGCVEHPGLGVPGLVNFVDARTRWVDDQVKQAVDEGMPQVVIVAAGYDSRAYRLGKPGVRFFEVDLPHASKAKQKLVEKALPEGQRSGVTLVAADLSKLPLHECLANTAFNPQLPALFTVEGLLYYLQPAAVNTLFQSISRLAAVGSKLCFDFLNADAVRGEREYVGFNACAQMVANKGEPFMSGFNPTPAAIKVYLEQYGFTADTVLDSAQLCRSVMPHLEWVEAQPPICSFYSYAVATKAAGSTANSEA